MPAHVKDGSFGKWLANARDWSISRNRFWGSADPGVEVGRPGVPAGGRVRLAGGARSADFGVRRGDRTCTGRWSTTSPGPTRTTRPGRSTMRRVPEVLDCWFESGSMPFAQVHYPFENADWFEHHYPGDFIVEYIGQTRGWFYTMHVLATALFDRPAFSQLRRCTASCWARTAARCPRACATTRTSTRCSTIVRIRRDALDAHVVAGAARRGHAGDRVVHPGRRCGTSCFHCGTSGTSSRCTPTRSRTRRRRAPTRRTCWTATCWPRPRALVADVTGQLDAYDVEWRVRLGALLSGRAHELVRAPVPGPVLGR